MFSKKSGDRRHSMSNLNTPFAELHVLIEIKSDLEEEANERRMSVDEN